MPRSSYPVKSLRGFNYVDEGPASSSLPPIVLLHGMMGDLDNWSRTIGALADQGYRVLCPVLPVYDMPMTKTNVPGLVRFVRSFVEAMKLERVVLAGNSLGGHVALLYTLAHPEDVVALVLSGASGVYEVEMGASTLRRRDREYIRQRAALTFYDPVHVTDDLLEDVCEVVNDRGRALRLIRMARSVQNETVTDRLPAIEAPTLLVWGKDDTITPPDVAHTFAEQLQSAELHLLDECGHAPMIEHPETFNRLTLDFLARTIGTPAEAQAS